MDYWYVIHLLQRDLRVTFWGFKGNTFPAVVYSHFAGFWLTLGAALNPSYGAYAAYSPDPNNPAAGLLQPDFYASFSFFLVIMALLSTIFCVASIRTNMAWFMIFLLLIPICKLTCA